MSIQKELSYGPVTIEVPARSQARRLDQFLHARFPSYSRARLQSLIKLGAVTVNEKTVKPSYAIAGEDIIVIELPTEHHRKIEPEAILLNILHEDAHLVVVNKPAGMVVHPARGNWSGTLVNALLHHCEALSSANEDPGRPGVVHRLDQYTSGSNTEPRRRNTSPSRTVNRNRTKGKSICPWARIRRIGYSRQCV